MTNTQSSDFMHAWYEDYYTVTATSQTYGEFCLSLFGRDFAQHGFADMAQIDHLLAVAGLGPGCRVLDLGCGNGAMDEYISRCTGAQVTGVDYSAAAISAASAYAHRNPGQLTFLVANMAALPFAAASFATIIAVDTLYFTDLDDTIATLKTILTADGQLLAYYSQGANPQRPLAQFQRETLAPDKTDLALALTRHGFRLHTWDFTAADYQHALRKKALVAALKSRLVAEGNQFLFDNRYGEACGVIAACEAAAHARYLVRATLCGDPG
ncbi:MAG TPA: class I SAM-dependent methyltransferase [Caldilineaceae bacterium]|nr:class I SAM-dependent methyltransferase [Caldilineaceae bacterium]